MQIPNHQIEIILDSFEKGDLNLALKQILNYSANISSTDEMTQIQQNAYFQLSRYRSIEKNFITLGLAKPDEAEINKIRLSTLELIESLKALEANSQNNFKNNSKITPLSLIGIWKGGFSKLGSIRTPGFIFFLNDFGVGNLRFTDRWFWYPMRDHRFYQIRWEAKHDTFQIYDMDTFHKFSLIRENKFNIKLTCIDASDSFLIGYSGTFKKI